MDIPNALKLDRKTFGQDPFGAMLHLTCGIIVWNKYLLG